MELVDQEESSPADCIALYEESLWCLYALQDELMQVGNPFREEDRVTIETCMFPLVHCSRTAHSTDAVFVFAPTRGREDEETPREL